MKRHYLTDCTGTGQQAGQGGQAGQGANTLTLRKAYSASVVLTAPGLALSFATLSTDVLISMARVFTGPPGPPGVFTEQDFITQPEADTDLQTA